MKTDTFLSITQPKTPRIIGSQRRKKKCDKFTYSEFFLFSLRLSNNQWLLENRIIIILHMKFSLLIEHLNGFSLHKLMQYAIC